MISVIVPVYNVEKYLDQCVQSILRQTYKDFELILVDDGSTDSSGKICDKYRENNDAIRVFHRTNGGPSIARNNAALEAKGELVTFIDSDDFVTSDYLEILYKSLIENDADISAGLMIEVDENKVVGKEIGVRGSTIMTGREALLNVLYQKDLDTTPCGMLFKKEIVLANPFPEGRYHEDDFTMFKYFLNANKVVLNKKIIYYYVQHKNSIMHSNGKVDYDELDAADHIEDYFIDKEEELLMAARSKKFSDYCQVLIKSNGTKNDDRRDEQISTYIKKVRSEIILDKNTRIKNKIAAILSYGGLKFLGRIGKLLSN